MKTLIHSLFSMYTKPRGRRRSANRQMPRVRGYIEEYEDRIVLSPMIAPLNDINGGNTIINVPVGKTFQLPIDGSDTLGVNEALMFSVFNNSNPGSVSAQFAPTSNDSLRMTVTGNGFSGDLILQLFEDLTPLTTARIIDLAMGGVPGFSYNNLRFHRIVQNFVAQGGDPAGNGTGGTGTDFADEFNSLLSFIGFGQWAMANGGDDDNDSQFFITDVDLAVGSTNAALRPPQHLNFNHTIFGQLTEGFATFAQLIATPVNGETPVTPVVMSNVGVFNDVQNAVLRLTAQGPAGSNSTITVRATNSMNQTVDQTFTINIVNDTDTGQAPGAGTTVIDDRPFLNVPASAFPNLISALTTNEDTPITIPVTELETTGNLTVHIRTGAVSDTGNATIDSSNVANLTVTIDQQTRVITITPAENFSSATPIDFLLAVRDATNRGGGANDRSQYDTQRIRLTINSVNDSPVATGGEAFFQAGSTTDIPLTGADGDPDVAQTLTFQIVQQPLHGAVTITNQTATFTPTLGANFQGSDFFTFRVMDNGGTANGGVDLSQPATINLEFDPATATVQGNMFVIMGSEIADFIDILLNVAGDALEVTINGRTIEDVATDGLDLIRVLSFDGDDDINVDTDIEISTDIAAGRGNDLVTSGDGFDRLRGNQGDDTIEGNGGDDQMIGQRGEDSMLGGEGDDTMNGGRDDDELEGEEGSDQMVGNAGNDEMLGGDNRDRMQGSSGDDTMDGEDGNDIIKGGFGSDSLSGSDGDDKLIGGPQFSDGGGRQDGNDTMDGGDGTDTLRGGAGDDDLNGGEDDDLDVLRGGEGDDNIELIFGFADPGRAGVATFEIPGAPRTHPLNPGTDGIVGTADDNDILLDPVHTATQTTPVDYTGFSNPPTYGPHHPTALDPVGVIDTEQDDATMVHNLEHGQIWISYDPANVSTDEINKLTDLVRDLNADDELVLTPRAANDDDRPIAVASWGRLLKLARFDGDAIRRFINRNAGTGLE